MVVHHPTGVPAASDPSAVTVPVTALWLTILDFMDKYMLTVHQFKVHSDINHVWLMILMVVPCPTGIPAASDPRYCPSPPSLLSGSPFWTSWIVFVDCPSVRMSIKWHKPCLVNDCYGCSLSYRYSCSIWPRCCHCLHSLLSGLTILDFMDKYMLTVHQLECP